jgi:hypothetical protein
MLKKLEENPACAYRHLAFLKKLHNSLTNEITLGKVIQLSSIVDQYAKAVQKRIDNGTRLATQQQAQTMFYEKAQQDQAEAVKLSTQAVEENPGVETVIRTLLSTSDKLDSWRTKLWDIDARSLRKKSKKFESNKK